jgi:hypothetical protein
MIYLQKFEHSPWETRELKTRRKFIKNMNILSEDDAVDYAIKNCQDFINNPIYISRGISSPAINVGVSPISSECFYSAPVNRTSRDNKNHYTLFIDNHPSWKNYPKRQKSFICTIGNTALGYIKYLVIPVDGSKWGIAPSKDIFNCFDDGIKDVLVDNLPTYLSIERFFANFEQTVGEISDKSYSKMKYDISNIEFDNIYDSPDNFHSTNYYNSIVDLIKQHPDDLFETIAKMLNPNLNDFHCLSYVDLYKKIEINDNNDDVYFCRRNECWTDSTCLFVDLDLYPDFLDKLRIKTKKQIYLLKP